MGYVDSIVYFLRFLLQNPIIREMIRNDPNFSPMMGAYLEQVANNPAMLEQVTQRMQDPAVRAQMQGFMGGAAAGGALPGMTPGIGMGGITTATSPAHASSMRQPGLQQQQQLGSDQDQTEDEMIAEAIQRSFEES
jgi:hypothetical protein